MSLELKGKVAVVTGAGGILCSEISRALSKQGARVALVDLREEAAERAADTLRATGGEALAVQADVTERESLGAAADRILEQFDRIDILVNGAGGNAPGASTSGNQTFFDLPLEALRKVIDLNLMGTLLSCQIFGKPMAETGSGSIINISSMTSIRPLTRIPGYGAAKAAVNNLTQWLAVYINQNYSPNVRVNAVAPGFFLTEQNRFLLLDERTGEPTERGKQVLAHTPMGRFGDPSDLCGCVVWLASDRSAFVNGVIIPIDGGFSAFGGV